MLRIRIAVVLAALATFAGPGSRADVAADTVGAIQDDLSTVVDGLQRAVQALAAADRAGSAAPLVDAETSAATLAAGVADPAAATALAGAAKKVGKAAVALSTAARNARAIAQDQRKSDAAVLASVKGASRKAGGLASSFMKAPTLGPIVILEELHAASAGFHKPGTTVPFRVRVYPPGSCAGPISVDLIDTAATFGKTSVLNAGKFDVDPEATFPVTMGPDAGAARVVVTACGRTSVRLLYNYGEKPVKGGGGVQVWHIVLNGSDTLVLCGYPEPEYSEDFTADVSYKGDLVQTLQHSGHDSDGTGGWSGTEDIKSQQPAPTICTLLASSPSGVAVSFEAWWSATTPSLHIRSTQDLIAHRYVTTYNGMEHSVPVQSVWLDVATIAPTTITGTWHTIGSGSADGNSSAGTWTATKQ